MYGWTGRILCVNLSEKKTSVWKYPEEWAVNFLGGRGLAVRILWEFLPKGTDPLSPHNILVLAAGPLTGTSFVNSGKLVVAAKSPLTNGYGDGNIGSWVAVQLRRAGYDAVVIEGKATKPSYIYIEDNSVEILPADDLWGLDTWEAEKRLKEKHGKDSGIVLIGPAGENLVRYATMISQEGRAGGRPGIGAVMGSKKLKAIVVHGTNEVKVREPSRLKKLFTKATMDLKSNPQYSFWLRQGTMMTIEWSQENSVLPTLNFSEGVFDYASNIDGYSMEKIKIDLRSCPYCVMPCGNVVKDYENKPSELDYENVAMLGSNIGLPDLGKIAVLNRLADMYGIDTISLGNVLAFYTECTQKGLIETEKMEWGDYETYKDLVEKIAYRKEEGNLLAEGVMRVSKHLGMNSYKFAMHVKGLEISAYDCHAAPAMALAYGTAAIGAHHKDAWVIAWEVKVNRFSYTREKAAKVIELQNIRGAFFESLATCRLPWVELSLDLKYYLEALEAATGLQYTLDDINMLGERIYTLIRAFWIREYGNWNREYDIPPPRWFEDPLLKGPLRGSKLDTEGYQKLLDYYYELRGWDNNGVPRLSTLRKLGLEFVEPVLAKITSLSE